MTEIRLNGCTAEPLMSYLKSLGVLRLSGEQLSPSISGCWKDGLFCLSGLECRESLVAFFCHEYRPTPVITPWNSASGFYKGNPAVTLAQIEESTSDRFAAYREAIGGARKVLERLQIKTKPGSGEKQALVRVIRSELGEEVVDWIDALGVLSGDRLVFAPVLGTGGNDGRLEFAVNFHNHLLKVVPLERYTGPCAITEQSEDWLRSALFAEGSPGLVSASSGQFHPGGVGGPNSTRGFVGDAVVNPWDYILMIEGALLLAGSVACRSGLQSMQKAAFPFTVRPSPAGWQTIAESDVRDARYEIWLPLWERPAGVGEVAHLLREGRAQVGKRAAESGSDFARAAAGLGVERGISSFTRFAFYKRSGKAYLASPLGRLAVRFQKHTDLIEEADYWLRRVRYQARGTAAPESIKRAYRAAENAIFGYCSRGRPEDIQAILIALSGIENIVGRSKNLQKTINPLSLSLRWLSAADDGSKEYYLARAAASVYGFDDGKADAPIRSNLSPVVLSRGGFEWDPGSAACVWHGEDLCRNLAALLNRRCLDASRAGFSDMAPLCGHYSAALDDIDAFLSGTVDELKTAELIKALALLRWPASPAQMQPLPRKYRSAPPELERLYAVIKLFFHHRPLLPEGEFPGQAAVIRPYQEMLLRLGQGRGREALKFAVGRLKIAGLVPLGTAGGRGGRTPNIVAGAGTSRRVAAALLFPIADPLPLMELVLRRNFKP